LFHLFFSNFYVLRRGKNIHSIVIMASVFLLIVYLSTILFFVPIQSNIIEQLREKRKRRNINNNIAEFDVNQTNNLGDKLETQLGRSYEYLGHSM